ncbi:MAG: branched-chain amino acid ABC transporter permease, partial [Clostridia bacterium]
MKSTNLTNYREGLRDGIPIALGYLAVSFTLGIAARNLHI